MAMGIIWVREISGLVQGGGTGGRRDWGYILGDVKFVVPLSHPRGKRLDISGFRGGGHLEI